MTRLKILTVGLIASFFLPLFASENTFAEWVQQNSTYVDSRSYIISTIQNENQNIITDNSFGNRNIPFNALTYISNEQRYLMEIVTYNAITDNSTDKFKSLMVDITMRAKGVQNPRDFGVTVITNRGNQYGGCAVNESGSDYIQFRCLSNLQDNSTVTGVYVRLGKKTLPSTPICILNDYYDSNCELSYMSINLTTTSDPAVAILQQQLEKQQQMINQFNQLNQTLDNQYQQEKQEESEREQQGNADANQLSGLFNFNVINPFNLLYTAVTPNQQCANIPTIANMLHVENTQYCNWFPNSIRSILTPVISLSSMMLVFGYLMAWLRRSSAPTIDIVTPDGRK